MKAFHWSIVCQNPAKEPIENVVSGHHSGQCISYAGSDKTATRGSRLLCSGGKRRQSTCAAACGCRIQAALAVNELNRRWS